ncbi:MAG: hypothetical protein IT208_11175, partial [Chthonomonadales bacterium]|nr:hypothetical protein [Chthonomonadales bacterium]
MYRRRWTRRWRRLAPVVAVCFLWSSTVSALALPSAPGRPGPGAAKRPHAPPGGARPESSRGPWRLAGPAWGGSGPRAPRPPRLSVPERGRYALLGSVPQHAVTLSPAPGPSYPWEGSIGDVNTGNGNKLTTLPLVGWTARGGMPVRFALYHNSQGSHNDELGYKWTMAYADIAAVATSSTFTLTWDTGLSYSFVTTDNGATWTPPSGIFERLESSGNPLQWTAFDLTTREQVTYHFTATGGNWYCATITDRNGNTISLNRSNGYLTSIVDPSNRTLTLHYSNGKVDYITDPLGRQWGLAYTSGNLTRVELPEVTVGGAPTAYDLELGYSASHCITSLTDPRGKSWTFAYYTDNSLDWARDPYQNQTTYAYTMGQTTVTDPNGKTTKHNYDTQSKRLSSVVDPLNNTESYTYNSANLVTRVTDRRGKHWDATFDGAGNQLTATDPLGHATTWTYNTFNEVLTATSELGKQAVSTYDTSGNLTRVQLKDSGGVVRSTTDYTPNTNGTLASKTDDNDHTTDYGYDTHGQLTSVTTHMGHETQFAVNALGARTGRTDALGRGTTYTLDEWNRVVGIDYPTGTDPSFTWDAGNHLIGWTDARGTWARTYDNAGRLTAESLGGSTRVSYAWDATGKKGLLSSFTDASSRTTTLAYTGRNELYQVTETAGTATYGYNATGAQTSLSNPNGTTATRAYDDAGRLTSVTNRTSTGTVLSSFSYGYDDDNQRTSCTEAGNSTVSWDYNGIGRLVGETRTGAHAFTATYSVDGVGNRTSQTIDNVTTSFSYNADDALTSTSGGFINSYGYNDNGEQTGRTLSGTSHSLSYDYDGQLVSITSGGATVDYAYDALGRRFSRTAGGVTTETLYAGTLPLLEKQGSNWTAAYAWGSGQIRRN